MLTLHFTLPFKTPVKAKALQVEVYDPEFFIDFGFAEKDPVRLVSAPAQCNATVEKPTDGNFPASAAARQGVPDFRGQCRHGHEFRQQNLRDLPVTRGAERQAIRRLFLAAVALLMLAASAHDGALAQVGLGGLRPPPADGVIGFILAKQALFYRALSGLIRAAKTDGSAYWALIGVSFVYGIFHAAGPGHGKAVISSYLLANEETWRRGVALSFASALLQALTAVVVVAVAAVLIGATAKMMGDTVRVIEIASYALIVLLGARLFWVKGRGFLRALQAARSGDRRRTRMCITITAMPMIIRMTTSTIITTATAMIIIARTTRTRTTYCRGATRTGRSRRNWPGRAAGAAGLRPSSPSVCGPVPARSSCSCSRWRKACSRPVSPRPS